ncbi:MAG: extracellular solute-binding protein, partial [Thiomonas sp.]
MAHALSHPVDPMRRALLHAALLGLAAPAAAQALAGGQPAYALYGRPKYPPGFSHFDYVDPRAPVGGRLLLTPNSVAGSFDTLNPFALKGSAAPGLGTLVFETLMTGSLDEPNTVYALLADDVAVADDGLSVQFRLNPRARFANGDAVTAQDVAFSFAQLTGNTGAQPQWASLYADVAEVRTPDARHVQFRFKRRNRELPMLLAGLPVFSPKWLAGRKLGEVRDAPIASGPYRIARQVQQRDIFYARRADYWGWQLPVRRGQCNFAEVGYKLYLDGTARLEAFKAGEFDLIQEFIARNWARQYQGGGFADGRLLKLELPTSNPAGFQGFVFNLRRPQFQDVRVRHALALALDFQWLNRLLFYGAYQRIEGYFANTPFEAHGKPGADELALLDPLRGELSPCVFGELPRMPSTDPPPGRPKAGSAPSGGSAGSTSAWGQSTSPHSLRGNLLQARALLQQAGWHWRDGALRNASGQALRIEYLDSQGAMNRIVSVYAQALEKLGIALTYRQVDFALYRQRMDTFDFDMTTVRFGGSLSPGNELLDRFGSKAAGIEGSDNVWGIRSAAVDRLIAQIIAANDERQLEAACRALDRVLVCGWYSVPQWYS